MEKVRGFFHNLSLRKSIALYMVFFAVLAMFAGEFTANACDSVRERIESKYYREKQQFYLTNDKGEQLGEGVGIWQWREGESMTETDERMYRAAETIPRVMYPVYAGLCVFCTAWIFYKKKLRKPLGLLMEAARKISENELDFQVKYESRDEMGKLCSSFELMRSELEKTHAQMWRAMEERKRLNAAFAHDLRTPLTVLKGYTEMLQLTGGSQEKKTADIMAKHLERLEAYADSMSCIQRLEDREVCCQSINGRELTGSLREAAEVVCSKGQKELTFREGVFSDRMEVDAELICEVFHNLLSNAARYAASRIEIQIREEERELAVLVWDDGKGFSDKALNKAGEAYFRENKAEDMHFGLGLYICKTLCEKHGGYLKIENGERGARTEAVFLKGI